MALPELAFQPRAKRSLGFEVFTLSSLLARITDGFTPMRMDFHVVYVGLRGRGAVMVDFVEVPIGKGLVTIVPRGRVHQYIAASRRADAWMLIFTPDFVGALSLLAPGAPAIVPLAPEMLALCEQAAAEYARPADAVQRELLASLCRTALLYAERGAGPSRISDELARFYKALDRDAMRTRSVAYYARAVGVTPKRLGALVHAHTGHTAKQVIADRALLEAKRLLAHTALSVKEIADRAGFSESTNFVKFFRHRVGQAPLAFRARFDHPEARSHRGGRRART